MKSVKRAAAGGGEELAATRASLPLPLRYFSLTLALVVFFILDLVMGSVAIPPGEVLRILIGLDPVRSSWATIINVFRLPKALTAGLAGAALAVSGLQMQTLFRNPLAGPAILGIGSGASLGVALVVLLGGVGSASRFLEGLGLVGDMGIVVAATCGSSVVLLLVLVVSRKVKSVITLLILGMLFGYATNALVSILIHSSSSEQIHAYISWTFGSFGGTTWAQLRVLLRVSSFSRREVWPVSSRCSSSPVYPRRVFGRVSNPTPRIAFPWTPRCSLFSYHAWVFQDSDLPPG